MHTRLEQEISRLRQDFSEVLITPQPNGQTYIQIANFLLPEGWMPHETIIFIIVPPDYPRVKPDGFLALGDIRAPNGQNPRGGSSVELLGNKWTKFCWQCPWDPSRENLWRYVKFIERRFVEERS